MRPRSVSVYGSEKSVSLTHCGECPAVLDCP
jgi:hypothetical protein